MIPFYQALADRFHELHSDIIRNLDSLPDEAIDWKSGSEMNSVAVIIVHLTGAERFLIGDVVMGESSGRNREAEFKVSGLTREDLVKRLNDTEAYMAAAFEKLTLADLETFRIHPRHGNQVLVAWTVLHALEHASTHVGHINITVQLWHLKMIGEG
jgi:hypothetical protein